MTMKNGSPSLVLAIMAILPLIGGCDGNDPLRGYFVGSTPRERYAESLSAAGLARTALARDWLAAGEQALRIPTRIPTPYRELGYLDPSEPRAEAYRVELRRGQRLAAHIAVETDSTFTFFMDLLVVRESGSHGDPVLLATADTITPSLDYVARRDGVYLLRIQPELLRGGRYTLTVEVTASLAFPVLGRDARAIRSQFGAPRDGGRRQHHGVDIFAPRGTPVLASSPGRVRRVSDSRLGGKVVWLRDAEVGYSLYYAHLDSQAVRRGQLVHPGDTVGFVGNTGNARTTPPHLHFGIYMRGTGPVDPTPFLELPPGSTPTLRAGLDQVGRWARITGDQVRLRERPGGRTQVLAELPQHTTVRVLAATGSWYRVGLPTGGQGFVSAELVETAERPIGSRLIPGGAVVRRHPVENAAPVDLMELDASVPVLGVFGGYALVTTPNGRNGWVVVE